MRFICATICAAAAASGLTGCQAARGQSTRYTSADMAEAAAAVRSQLAQSDWLAGRGPQSQQIILQPTNVRNISSERIDQADQRAIVTRVLYAPGLLELFRERNIAILLPEHMPRQVGEFLPSGPAEAPPGAQPTHVLNAEFGSIRRAGAAAGPAALDDVRKDVFIVEYTVVDLSSREIVWTGSFRFARLAHGLLID